MNEPRLSFIATAWAARRPLALPCLLACLRNQSMPDWECLVADSEDYPPHRAACATDPRFIYCPEPLGRRHERKDMYHATDWVVDQARGEWLAFPNDDGLLVPWFAERMIRAAEQNSWDLAYCNIVLGSPHTHAVLLRQTPRRAEIDKTGFIVRREWFCRVKGFVGKQDCWPETDGALAAELVEQGARHGGVDEFLVVHN